MDQADNEALAALLGGRGPEGQFRYSDDELLHALPLMVLGLARADPTLTFSPFVEDLLAQTAQKAGVKQGATPEAVMQALETYYQANPVNPRILQDIDGHVRALAAQGSGGNEAQAMDALLGGRPKLHALQQNGPRPQGTIAGGPMAAALARQGGKLTKSR